MGKLRGCAWGLGLVLLLSEAGVAMPEPTILVQQGETAPTDEKRAAAQRAFDEGWELYQQGTAESLRQAIEKGEVALPLWRELGDREWESATLLLIGKVHSDLGEKQRALEYYEQALPLSQAVGDRSLEATTLNNIGRVYSDLGELQKALEYYEQALPLRRAVGDRTGEAIILGNIGVVYSNLGEQQRALEYYERSLLLSQAVGDRIGEALTLSNIGGVYLDLGEPQRALEYYEQALPLRRAVGDRAGEARTLSSIGLVYSGLREFQNALEYYEQSLPLSQAVGDRVGEAITLNNIGGIYSGLGEQQRALEYFERSLLLSQAVGDRAGEAATLNNIGDVYLALGELQKALEYFERALPLRRAVGDRAGEARTLNNIGAVYLALGELQRALEYFEQSLTFSQTVGDRAGEAATFNNIGLVYSVLGLGELQKALEYYERALPLRRAVGDRTGEAQTLTNSAIAERDLGNLETALTQIQAAITIIEDLRTNIGSQELRASYFAQNQDYYEFYINLLMELHRQNPNGGYDGEALHISERARARGLLELLTEANADIRQGVNPELLERERTLQQQLNATDTRRTQLLGGQYTDTELDAVKQEIDNLLNQLQTLEGQIRANSPRYAELQYPEPLTLTEIQQQILDDDTLLLQYSLGEEASYLWAVSKTGITSYELPPRAEIEAAALPFLDYLKSPTGINPESGIPLSQILLEPVAEQLNEQRLLIVGDGILQTIPFAALPVPGSDSTLLLETHEIASLPSASSLAITRQELANRPIAPKTLAVLADPVFSCLGDDRIANSPACETADTIDPTFNNNPNEPWNSATRAAEFLDTACTNFDRLRYTQTEAESILSLVPESQRFQATGFDASRATATSDELANYQIVHLATHGCVGKEHPSLHGIVLSLFDAEGTPQDGFLRLQDIFNLTLPAELVVLSACQTGIGDNVKGEGIVGLTRGFMYAGAKRVAVSLWSVNDYATSELMEKFYQEMLDGGLTATAAMRAAQLEMMRAGKPAYEWAAFVVQGEWN
ncbi:MAG: tetratricopeptide repeat protein [Cyanobacteriota bacterium]|nr:tetratricopeptide repeat protein [Cyanobacteriota bacterium]